MRLALTKRCEYGIRILVYLAMRPRRTRVTTADLARICEVPPGNVPTIVNILSRAGYLSSSPGRNGGCELAVEPRDLSMLDVAHLLEGNLELEHCLLDSRHRCSEYECYLCNIWQDGRAAALAALSDTTLADAAEWAWAKGEFALDGVPGDIITAADLTSGDPQPPDLPLP